MGRHSSNCGLRAGTFSGSCAGPNRLPGEHATTELPRIPFDRACVLWSARRLGKAISPRYHILIFCFLLCRLDVVLHSALHDGHGGPEEADCSNSTPGEFSALVIPCSYHDIRLLLQPKRSSRLFFTYCSTSQILRSSGDQVCCATSVVSC